MASAKRLGFYLGDEKVTLVEFDKNVPVKTISSSISKNNTGSPFSSNLTEEIQTITVLKEILQVNRITGGSYYVSLPMKEIILRSFFIPFVKQEDVRNIIKFEAKKYVPFDIEELSYVYHVLPFAEGQNKRWQVFFFAVRKEVLTRYARIFGQVNAQVTYCEPYIVSLVKSLLFRKEIKPTDRLAFLILDKQVGRICFIENGIPHFTREFPITTPALLTPEGTGDSQEALKLKIINEVWDSFDFYRRQFNGERIGTMLVSSGALGSDLLEALETELKVQVLQYSPVINTGMIGQSSDMDAIYAMGAGVVPPTESLSKFNFIGDKTTSPGFEGGLIGILKAFKESIFTLLICVLLLIGTFVYFQTQLNLVEGQHAQLLAREGEFSNVGQDAVQSDLQQNVDKLKQYKSIRATSDMPFIILKVASHVPVGTLLTQFTVTYGSDDFSSGHVSIDIQGTIVNKAPSEQIAIVNQMVTDFKNDQELASFINNVTLVSIKRSMNNNKEATEFTIHFS